MRRAQPGDSRAIARLHRDIINWGLLAQLGEDVVTAFYEATTRSPWSFCFVAESERGLEGFAAGVTDWPQHRREVIRRTWWAMLRAFPRVLRRLRWRRLQETAQYVGSGREGVHAEFLSIGVRADAPGRLWLGVSLARAVIREFQFRGVRRIRGVVWEKNERALRFFEGVGFRFVSSVEIHPSEWSRTFVVDLAPVS